MKFYSKKLKSFFAIMCVFFLIAQFSLTAIPVKAAETTPKITYTVTGEATVGKQITINLNVSNISGLYGGSWDFAYDPSILKVDEITSGELTSSIPQTTTSNKSGHAYFWFTKTGDTTGVSTTDAKSIAKIKATVLKEGTVKIGTTNSDSSFGVNNKSSLVKLSDKNGDKISYSSEDKSISCAKPVVVLQPGTYDDSNINISYIGSWNTDKNSIHHNGSAQYSKTSGSYLTFSFNGTGFNLFSCTTPSRGIAKVTVDNKSYNVDLYSSTVKAKNTVFSINDLYPGTHKVKIEFTGTKNPASSANTILIDGFTILNDNFIDDTDSLINYYGSWNTDKNSIHHNGSAQYSKTSGSYLTFSFNGTGFNLFSCTTPSRGIAKVTVDNKSYNVDLYSSTIKAKNNVFSINNLTNGTHNVKIEFTGTKNPASSASTILIDGISILNGNIINNNTFIDDTDSLINYYGSWNTDKNSIHHNGSAQYSKTSGSYLTFSFNGTGFNLFSCTTPSRGIAKVTVDNKSYNVDLYSSTIKAKNNVFSINNLTNGTHKVKIEFTGTKNPASSASTILIDGISILNGNITNNTDIIDNTDSIINYYGSWNTDKNSIHHNGSAQYSKTSGSYLTFSFNGTGFNLFSCTTPSRGIAKVTVDNKSYNVDLYSSTVKAKNTVFSINDLYPGTHKVKIEFTGTKNPASSANTILIDGFTILNDNFIDDTDSLINYYGSWNTDKNSIHHNGSAQYSKTSGSYLTFSFNGTGFNLFSCTTPSRGIAKVTVDNKSYNVDLYSSTVKAKNSVFSINNLTNGTHNVKIEFTGTKNPASSASTILIDGISIIYGKISQY